MQVPDNILKRIADPAVARLYQAKGEPIEPAQLVAPIEPGKPDKYSLKLERDLHGQYMGFLKRHHFENVIHASPTQRSTIRPGWPDFTVMRKSHEGVLFIEFKVGRNELMPIQETVIAQLTADGWTVHVLHTYEEAVETTNKFFNL